MCEFCSPLRWLNQRVGSNGPRSSAAYVQFDASRLRPVAGQHIPARNRACFMVNQVLHGPSPFHTREAVAPATALTLFRRAISRASTASGQTSSPPAHAGKKPAPFHCNQIWPLKPLGNSIRHSNFDPPCRAMRVVANRASRGRAPAPALPDTPLPLWPRVS